MSLRQRQDEGEPSSDVPISALLTSRRYLSQLQQTQQHTRGRDTSDADISSDVSSLSEADLHRDLHSDDYSDYETPLGGRWDLTVHWHLADYSEGVEGDADDDDDEERGNDTDLSDGSGLGRNVHLDLGRVREILGSSPSSTPIILTGLSSPRNGSATVIPARTFDFDFHSSASEDIDFRRRPLTTPAAPERTVRFSREPQRDFATLTSMGRPRSPGRDTTSSDLHQDTAHEDMDDRQADSGVRLISPPTDNAGSSSSSSRLYRTNIISSRTRLSSAIAHDFENHFTLQGSREADQSSRSGGHRIHIFQRPASPELSYEERRLHYYQHSSSRWRHGLSPSSASRISPYWSSYQYPGSSSPPSSLPSSPASSTSTSRMASPAPEFPSLSRNKSSEGGSSEQTSQNQKGSGNGDGGQNRYADRKHRSTVGTASTTAPSSTLMNTGHQRRAVSSTISSLPSFASSAFAPRAEEGSAGSSRLYRSLRSNHPRRQCCFLQPGQKFHGSQNLKSHLATLSGLRTRQTEEWDVKVTISAVDYEAGAVYGLMEAIDVPMSASNVVTFWEGEIIDFENHTFWTKKWAAKARTDLEHWKRLEAFQGIDEKYIIKGAKTGKFRGHIDQKYIFMRWKEKHFVNVSEHTSGLTIAGFYYLSMRRSDGYVEGYYHDQQSTPFQHLSLKPVFEAGGFSTSIFEVA
ncbi:vacuolar import and degradation protein-domain-containing protein [Gamsiella multidivaricata]|uniref:vacuolar import and degradation protein-domain-containing protein n=1 Tax=Gamsiella multidivaricata TaxID=101098 RepID=UPI0022209381|nr:vacuolar import and degradation protein-domain-containing protein [Gamsiella multidivaricata]KAG0370475.1 hypothetical protein BGZ54_006127 [Gamsiella multidivaricata]KAI7827071.1 vacuolar import and degradation protein-domain-containing protein [Gamsiella multidivaricata]